MGLYEKIQETAQAIQARSNGLRPKVGIILGSGLGGFAEGFARRVVLPYAELPHFPHSSVPGHAGRLVLGEVGGEPVVAMQGRVHAYEGYSPEQVAFPARVLCALGIHTLVVTNAAGGVNLSFQPGDLMVITDHINLSGYNPLTGHNDERLGPRFPDMSTAYPAALQAQLLASGERAGAALKQGVYAIVAGPSYETPAEIRMLRAMGADAVGMSTVPEVIAARHMGVRVAGVSCITNLAAGIGEKPLSHEEVAETANRVKDVFARLLEDFLPTVARAAARTV
jgi:purine-nucleoside phosphorylase